MSLSKLMGIAKLLKYKLTCQVLFPGLDSSLLLPLRWVPNIIE
jgi:hypothetical protein